MRLAGYRHPTFGSILYSFNVADLNCVSCY